MENVFNIKENDRVNLVGAGGKTSLLFMLGDEFQGSLLTTTTKIFEPLTNKVYLDKLPEVLDETAVIVKSQKENKLYGLNCEELDHYASYFKYTFIEADGSRMLPLKGWSKSEPVLCNSTNKTIGIVDLTVLGKPSESSVFRLDEYQKITDDDGEVKMKNLVDVILHPDGLFKGSKHKILYVNKVESEQLKIDANQLIQMLQEDKRFDLDRIVIGSIHNKEFTVKFVKRAFFVLASGLSKRMGENKLLMPYKGKTLIEHVLGKLSNFPEQIFLITNGSAYDYLKEKYSFEVLLNKDYEEGQGAAIRLATSVDVQEYAYFLGDMPEISQESIEILRTTPGKIKMIRSSGVSSAPLFLNNCYRDELAEAKADEGAKQVLKHHLDEITYIDVSMDELFDVDRKEDLK